MLSKAIICANVPKEKVLTESELLFVEDVTICVIRFLEALARVTRKTCPLLKLMSKSRRKSTRELKIPFAGYPQQGSEANTPCIPRLHKTPLNARIESCLKTLENPRISLSETRSRKTNNWRMGFKAKFAWRGYCDFGAQAMPDEVSKQSVKNEPQTHTEIAAEIYI